MRTKPYKGDKHQKSGKHDGHKPAEEANERDKKNPPEYRDFKGNPID